MNTELMQRVHDHVSTNPDEFDMDTYECSVQLVGGDYQPCQTTRCIAGWAAHFSGLHANFDNGQDALGLTEDVAMRLFYCDNDEALPALKLLIENPDLDEDVLVDKLEAMTHCEGDEGYGEWYRLNHEGG